MILTRITFLEKIMFSILIYIKFKTLQILHLN